MKEIVDLFPGRNGLIFSATTEFADILQEKLGDISMTFHSKLGKKEQTDVIKKFKDGRTNKIIGKLDNTFSLLERSVPEKSPTTELIRTTITDSLKIFLK